MKPVIERRFKHFQKPYKDKKKYTLERATRDLEVCTNHLGLLEEMILTWKPKIGYQLNMIDTLILGVDGFESAKEFVDYNYAELKYSYQRIKFLNDKIRDLQTGIELKADIPIAIDKTIPKNLWDFVD